MFIFVRAVRFYAACVAWAAKGTLEKANAWFWLIGIPLFAAAGYYFGLGPLTIPDHPSGLIVLMVIAVALTWLVIFLIRLLVSPGKLFGDAEETTRALSAKLIPKLNVYLVAGGVQIVQTTGPLSKWVQITVECTTSVGLEECEAKVVRIQRKNLDASLLDILHEPVSCNWSQRSGEIRQIGIAPYVSHAANLFSILDFTDAKLEPQFDHVKIQLRDALQKPGIYRIEVVVTAKNSSAVKKSFLLDWGGSFASIMFSAE